MNNIEGLAPESEIRLMIHDIKTFRSFLDQHGAVLMKTYSFTDHCYRPAGLDHRWVRQDLDTKIMRLREWREPQRKSELLYSKVELIENQGVCFKRSVFPGGKLRIFEGDRETIENLMQDWNFEFWFKIEKEEGQLLELPKGNFILALEKIKDFGYSAEIEIHVEEVSAVQEQFAKHLDFFQEIKNAFQTTHRSLPALVAEALGL